MRLERSQICETTKNIKFYVVKKIFTRILKEKMNLIKKVN